MGGWVDGLPCIPPPPPAKQFSSRPTPPSNPPPTPSRPPPPTPMRPCLAPEVPPLGGTFLHVAWPEGVEGTGGRPGPVLVCDPPMTPGQTPPPDPRQEHPPPTPRRNTPPPDPREEHPPPRPPAGHPHPQLPPPRVLKDSWGVGRIRTGCSRPPRGGRCPVQIHAASTATLTPTAITTTLATTAPTPRTTPSTRTTVAASRSLCDSPSFSSSCFPSHSRIGPCSLFWSACALSPLCHLSCIPICPLLSPSSRSPVHFAARCISVSLFRPPSNS